MRHPTSVQIVGQISPPIIATPANLAQARGINQQQAPPTFKQIGSVATEAASSSQSSQGLQLRKRLRQAHSEISATPMSSAGYPLGAAQGAERQVVEHVGQDRAQEIGRAVEAAGALEGFQKVCLLVECRGQAGDDLGRPGVATQIDQLRLGGGQGMMGTNRHGLLQDYGMASDSTGWLSRFDID